MKEYENKIIEKDEKIRLMEMQKKNEDLASRIENDLPEGMGNELGDLEGNFNGNNILNTYENGDIEPYAEYN